LIEQFQLGEIPLIDRPHPAHRILQRPEGGGVSGPRGVRGDLPLHGIQAGHRVVEPDPVKTRQLIMTIAESACRTGKFAVLGQNIGEPVIQAQPPHPVIQGGIKFGDIVLAFLPTGVDDGERTGRVEGAQSGRSADRKALRPKENRAHESGSAGIHVDRATDIVEHPAQRVVVRMTHPHIGIRHIAGLHPLRHVPDVRGSGCR